MIAARAAVLVGFVLSFLVLQSGHPSMAVDKYDKSCVWFPDNAAGSKWTFYCPGEDSSAKDETGSWNGFQLIGGDSAKAKEDLDKWRKNELNLTGKALEAAGGLGNEPKTLEEPQNRSFMLDGAEKAQSPCVLMDGKHGGANEKREVKCVEVREMLEKKQHPCTMAPPQSRSLCIQQHLSWSDYAKPAPGDLPSCDTTSKISVCPDNNVVAQNAKSEDSKFLNEPITFIRDQSKNAVRTTLLWWIKAPDPLISETDKTDCDDGTGKYTDRTKPYPCSRNTTDFLTRHTNPFTYFLALACVIFAGFKLAYTRDASSVKDVIKGTITLVLVTGSAIFLVNVAVRACQGFTDWIVVRGLSPETNGAANTDRALQEAADRFAQSLEGFDSIVLFLLAALIIISSNMVQYFYMTARLFFVIVLTGTLPLTAAATSTAAGRNLFQRHISYLIAFIFVKPASMIIFVAGARLWAPPGYQGLDYSDQFRGLFVLALVTLVGPATVRVVFAMTGPAAGSNAANIGAAGAVLTVGARSVGAASNLVRHRNQGGNN
ncbi:hypothetical protein [Embleya sp. NPDC050493]|uniref:hypothetical protein n=1 Tax=Embleya sp. NPDC050493 TaxID=3363989 RepID=UPI003796E1B4